MRCLQRASAFLTNEARIYKCMGFSPDSQATVPDDALPEETYRFHALVTLVPESLNYSGSGVLSFSFSSLNRVGVTVLFGVGGLSSPGRLRVSYASAPVTFEGRPGFQTFSTPAAGAERLEGERSKVLIVFTAYSDNGPLTDTSPNAQVVLVDVAPGGGRPMAGESHPEVLCSIIRIGASFYSLEKVYGAAETADQMGAVSSAGRVQDTRPSGSSGQNSSGPTTRPAPSGQMSGQMLAARLTELQRQAGGRGSSRAPPGSRRLGSKGGSRTTRGQGSSSSAGRSGASGASVVPTTEQTEHAENGSGMLRDLGAPGACSVCLSYPCSVLALPCRHLALCRQCAEQVRRVCTQCPICRTQYEALVDLCYIEAENVISGDAVDSGAGGGNYAGGQVGMSLA